MHALELALPRWRTSAGKLVAGGAFVDVKALFDAQALAAAGYRVWRL